MENIKEKYNLIELATKIVGDNTKSQEIRDAHLNLIHNLKLILEIKDKYTAGHSERVSQYAILLGKELGLNKEQLNILKSGALIHDIGKLGIDDRILNSTSRLSDEEFEKIKQHPILGTQILGDSILFKDLIPTIKHHHEKYDGTGYPDNLKGEEIPLLARITAVADTFDAMTSTRSYRKALSNEIAKEEIKKCSGTQFDPKIAQVMINLLENKEEEILKIQKDTSFGESENMNITDKIIDKISKEQLLKDLEVNKDNTKLSAFLNNELKQEEILINIFLEYIDNQIINKEHFKETVLDDLESELAIKFKFLIPESFNYHINLEILEEYYNLKSKALEKVNQIKAMGIKEEFNNTYDKLLEKAVNSNNINQIIILKMTKELLNKDKEKIE